ncbi:small membrane protein [Klebsiella pneumoniae]|nr:small membrane protein [Klebsiella pneumoniae]
MANIIFLAVAAILLIVSVYFLISFIKDQKKTKLTLTSESGEKKT